MKKNKRLRRTHITSPPNLVKSFGFLRRGHTESGERSTQLGESCTQNQRRTEQTPLFVHQKSHGITKQTNPQIKTRPNSKDDSRNQKLPLLGSEFFQHAKGNNVRTREIEEETLNLRARKRRNRGKGEMGERGSEVFRSKTS